MTVTDFLAILGAISTATVAILSIYVPLRTEKVRLRAAKVEAELKAIDEATLNFLRELSNLRHWAYENLAKIAPDEKVELLYTNLQVTQYAWERAI